MSRPMPRLFVIRHGETEWSINGSVPFKTAFPVYTDTSAIYSGSFGSKATRMCCSTSIEVAAKPGIQTGRTDIPLTARGEEQVKETAQVIVGDGLVVDPKNLCTVFVSPRQRAHKTFHLLFDHLPELPHHVLSEEVREWDYGDYEGLLSSEIKQKNPAWTIWNDGCPGGESVADMEARVDTAIAKVREYHRQYKEDGLNSRDVMIIAHGHFSRVLISRWINFPLRLGTHFNVEPGSVTVLSYNHNSLAEPALNALNLYANVI